MASQFGKLQKWIKKTDRLAARETERDMASMYRADARDGSKVLSYLKKKKWKKIDQKLNNMDTDPRDEIWVRIPKKLQRLIEGDN